VNGDHGINEVLRDGKFVEDDSAWERTLLLVKPARDRGPLRIAKAIAHMEDIAPTLRALLGAPPDPAHEGRVLSEALGAQARSGSAAHRTAGGQTPATSTTN